MILSLVGGLCCHGSVGTPDLVPIPLPLVFVVLLEVFSAKARCALCVSIHCRGVVWFGRRGANWDSYVLDPPPSVMVPRDCQAWSISSAPFDSVPVASSSVELGCCAAAYAAALSCLRAGLIDRSGPPSIPDAMGRSAII